MRLPLFEHQKKVNMQMLLCHMPFLLMMMNIKMVFFCIHDTQMEFLVHISVIVSQVG